MPGGGTWSTCTASQLPELGVAVLLNTAGLAADGNLSARGVASYTGSGTAPEPAACQWGLDGAPTGSYACGAAPLYAWDCFPNLDVLCPTPPADPSGSPRETC